MHTYTKKCNFYIYTHIHAYTASRTPANIKNVFACNDTEVFHCMEIGLTETSFFPGKKQKPKTDLGIRQRGVEILPLP